MYSKQNMIIKNDFNLIIIGEVGVGKSTVLNYLVSPTGLDKFGNEFFETGDSVDSVTQNVSSRQIKFMDKI
jgi:predicted ATPase